MLISIHSSFLQKFLCDSIFLFIFPTIFAFGITGIEFSYPLMKVMTGPHRKRKGISDREENIFAGGFLFFFISANHFLIPQYSKGVGLHTYMNVR